MKRNTMLLSSNLDNVNPVVNHFSAELLYGWLCIAGLFCLLAFTLRESSLRPHMVIPKLSNLRRAVKYSI